MLKLGYEMVQLARLDSFSDLIFRTMNNGNLQIV